MILIIGGAFQGKGSYGKAHYPGRCWQEAASLSREELFLAQGILGLEAFIKKEMEEGREVARLGRELLEKNPGAVVTCREVGCGVVPVDPLDRAWREAVGRICTELAAGDCRVIRVFCGIGSVIKDA